MLKHITIRDFAIIDHLDLDLHHGLSALTGETGAGKSILIDAIGLVLGDRADSGVVRFGSERTDIILSVDTQKMPELQQWLMDNDLDSGDDCLLRRVIRADGGSKAYINGSPTTVTALRELGERVVDIHGQHAHQSLMKRDQQRHLVDQFAGLDDELRELKSIHREWKDLDQRIQKLSADSSERDARLQRLRFDWEELNQLELSKEEMPQLDEEQRRLANANALLSCCERVAQGLYDTDEGSVYDHLSQHIHDLETQLPHDESLQEPLEQLMSARVHVQESAEFVRRYHERTDLDPSRLQWLEDRLAAIHDLARKHRVEPKALPALLEQWAEEIEQLDGGEYDIDQLMQQREHSEQGYRALAGQVHQARMQAARQLSDSVTQSMQELGMQGGRFEVVVDHQGNGKPSPNGLDQVDMQVSANPGQPMKALMKVASGGELSRISLAIQMAAIAAVRTPCLIFDEVDSGIGGAVAESVGKQLRRLGQTHQVLCVTHLPQVAAQAHEHYQVSKHKTDDSTDTGITRLTEQERTEEIARMLGGQDITDTTRQHAAEMIQKADQA